MIGDYKRGGVGFVLVKLNTVYKTQTGRKGLGGQDIVLGDAEYDRNRHAQTFGDVIQIPIALGKAPLYGISAGVPGYGPIRMPVDADAEQPSDAIYSRPNNQYRFQNDIAPEIQVGDRVYFPWMATFDKRNIVAQAPDKSVYIFKVTYDMIYCAVRAGRIIPIGAHVLIDPIFETWESILKPTYYDFKDAQGKPIEKPKDQWMQIKSAPKTVDREGVVRHIGTPLRGDRCTLEVGMKVLYKPKLQNLLEIEGQKYFIVRQNQVMCYSVATAEG